jgi:lipopolysaccharide biosynthesis glycosyltransferase
LDLNETIHVAVASNNNYAVLVAALIKSIIFNHHSSEKIIFYIFNDAISIKNQNRINSLIDDPQKISFQWIKAGDALPPRMKFPIDNSTFPFTAFLRLFAPYYIPNEVSKLIYFDADMIMKRDVSELWKFNLENYTLAAVVDVGKIVSCEWGGIPNYQQLGLNADAKYFNSGLMIINPKLWRENNIPVKVFEAMNDNMKYVNYADQYGLNVVFANNWKIIDPRWNWFAFYEHPDPFNIHFLDIKPTFKSYKSDETFKKEFFKYLDMTPWKGMKLQSDYVRLYRKAIIKIKKKLKQLVS